MVSSVDRWIGNKLFDVNVFGVIRVFAADPDLGIDPSKILEQQIHRVAPGSFRPHRILKIRWIGWGGKSVDEIRLDNIAHFPIQRLKGLFAKTVLHCEGWQQFGQYPAFWQRIAIENYPFFLRIFDVKVRGGSWRSPQLIETLIPLLIARNDQERVRDALSFLGDCNPPFQPSLPILSNALQAAVGWDDVEMVKLILSFRKEGFSNFWLVLHRAVKNNKEGMFTLLMTEVRRYFLHRVLKEHLPYYDSEINEKFVRFAIEKNDLKLVQIALAIFPHRVYFDHIPYAYLQKLISFAKEQGRQEIVELLQEVSAHPRGPSWCEEMGKSFNAFFRLPRDDPDFEELSTLEKVKRFALLFILKGPLALFLLVAALSLAPLLVPSIWLIERHMNSSFDENLRIWSERVATRVI